MGDVITAVQRTVSVTRRAFSLVSASFVLLNLPFWLSVAPPSPVFSGEPRRMRPGPQQAGTRISKRWVAPPRLDKTGL